MDIGKAEEDPLFHRDGRKGGPWQGPRLHDAAEANSRNLGHNQCTERGKWLVRFVRGCEKSNYGYR